MRQLLLVVVIVLGFTATVFWWNYVPTRETPTSQPAASSIERATTFPQEVKGNTKVHDFRKAKKLARQIYRGMEFTFYCGCAYRGNLVDHQSCGYISKRNGERAYRIEWEHVVPAYDFGRSFKEWRQGDSRCVDERGKRFKGRSCARLVSEKFRRMEADLFNLVPEIGELNQERSNYPMGLLPTIHYMFGQCQTKIAKRTIEPRPEIRGFIARTYKYMNVTYPGHGIISRKNSKLFQAWHEQYPPTRDEMVRAKRISKFQGNHNPFLLVPNRDKAPAKG